MSEKIELRNDPNDIVKSYIYFKYSLPEGEICEWRLPLVDLTPYLTFQGKRVPIYREPEFKKFSDEDILESEEYQFMKHFLEKYGKDELEKITRDRHKRDLINKINEFEKISDDEYLF